MRQIVYHSLCTAPGDGADLPRILEQSRHNNAIDGITGLLWSDGMRFLQVFEGPAESVAPTWARIRSDSRHNAITIVHDRPIVAREFGYWTMAYRRGSEPSDVYDGHMRYVLAYASPDVSRPFLEMISTGEVGGSIT